MKLILILSWLTFFNMGCAVFSKYDIESFKVQYPAVYGLIEMDEITKKDFVYYASLLQKERKIKRFAQLKKIYDYRDSFILPGIAPLLEEHELYYEKLQEKLNLELSELGVGIITAENIYLGVGPVLVKEQKLAELAPKDFQLYQQFQHYKTLSKGSEYPFLDVMEEKMMLIIGEEFLKNDSTNRYWRLIKNDFNKALVTFFDIHQVIGEDEEFFAVGNTNTALWPYVTLMKDREQFIKENDSSLFSDPLRSIIDEISVIDLSEDKLFLVVTDWNKTYENAVDKRLEYLLSGDDIPHLLAVKRKNGEELFANVFRFYSYRDKAEKSLSHIKKGHSDAEIISVKNFTDLILQEN